MSEWDCVVVGGGVAGLGAALVLGRARRRTLLLDLGGQSNRPAAHVGGLLGHEGVAPADLYANAREQLGNYDSVVIREAEAVDARADGDGFLVTLADEVVATRAIVLATGMDYEIPAVPGFADHWGGAVFHCPFCHGWEVRDGKLAVYAPPAVADRLAALLRGWSSDVTVVDPDEIAGLRAEDGTVRALLHRDGTETLCDGVLVHAPLHRRGRLPEQLGLALTDEGFVAVDALAHTSVPGVYAAGDLAVAPQQVAVALGSGHLAGFVAARELLAGRPA